MSASTQNLRQRHALAQLTGAASYAAHAALPVDRTPHVNVPWELSRAGQLDLQLQADALSRCVRAAGEVGCAPVERLPSLRERLIASLRADYGRAWWLALIGAGLYFTCGTAAALALVAMFAGWQP